MRLKLAGRGDHVGAAAVLGLLALVLWAWTSSSAFRFDDASHVLFASEYPWWGMLVDADQAYRFSRNNYTPFNTLIYEVGLGVFGNVIRGYYALHVAVLWAVAWATWWMLHRAVGAGVALAAAVLFMLSPPTWYVAGQLTVHHYVLGLLFAILHTCAFLRHLAMPRTSTLLLSMGCYLMAALCKEIYVLWPGALLFLPVAGWWSRVRVLSWHLPMTALYAFLRIRALDGIGGYSATSQSGEWWQWLQGLSVVPAVMLGDTTLGTVGLVALAVFGLALLRQLRASLFAAAAVLLVVAPLVMLVKYPGLVTPDRYFFLPWWLLATGVGLSALLFRGKVIWGVACAAIVVAAMGHTHRQARGFMSVMRDFDALNGLLATPSPQPRVVLIPDIFPIGYVNHVSVRYARFLAQQQGIQNLLLINPLDAQRLAAARNGVWVLDRSQHRMVRRELTELVPQASLPGTGQVAWTYEVTTATPEYLRSYFPGRTGGRVTQLVREADRLRMTVNVPVLGNTMHLRALFPGGGRIQPLPDQAAAPGEVSFSFSLQPDNAAGLEQIEQELCIAVSADYEEHLFIEGLPSTRCAEYLRPSRLAEH